MKGKRYFITGAAKGIGKATALELALKGAQLILTDIDLALLEKTASEIETNGIIETFRLDVTNYEQVKQVLSIVGKNRIDGFVNNAGIAGKLSPMHETPISEYHRVMEVNVNGVFFGMREQIKHLLNKGGGTIVNISSMAGKRGVALGSPYSASKHAVLGLTKSAALEYGNLGIRVNAVCPTFIETDILETVPDKVLEFSKNYRVPMKRLGQVHEVAKAIVWLLSEESSYVNGESLVIDGGFSVG